MLLFFLFHCKYLKCPEACQFQNPDKLKDRKDFPMNILMAELPENSNLQSIELSVCMGCI